jgi:hypothetical protein
MTPPMTWKLELIPIPLAISTPLTEWLGTSLFIRKSTGARS